MLVTASRGAAGTDQHRQVGEAALALADPADPEEYALVLDLCQLVRTSAQRTRQFALAKQLSLKIEELEQRQNALQDYWAAWNVLEQDPVDPAANLAAGRYLCFVEGQWTRGVPMLALGSDVDLKAVAVKDLRGANSAEDQAAIGDGWWNLAQRGKGAQRDAMLVRAGWWYRQAEPALRGGLGGLRVKQRLDELGEFGLSGRLDAGVEAAPAAPSADRGLGALVDASSPSAADASRTQTFSWRRGESPTRLIPMADGLCVLSAISGNFLGGGEGVEVTVAADGWWYLNGRARQWISAEATAISRGNRRLAPARAASWKPGSGAVRLISARQGFGYLSAVSGGFRGAGEAVRVGLEADGWWYLSGKSVTSVEAAATIVLWPSRGPRPEITSFAWRSGDAPVKMIHRDEGFCALAGIGGAFHGGGEQVEIALGTDDFWYLRGRSAQDSTFAEAIAVRLAN